MTEVALVPALPAHAEAIAANPRQGDVIELAALGTDPLKAMRAGMWSGAQTALVDGEPVCMFGAAPYSILGGMGVPWLIGGAGMDTLTAHKALLRLSRGAVADMRRQFPTLLFNVVDERNTAAQRWLHWLGFEFGDLLPIGRDGEPFRMFFLRG